MELTTTDVRNLAKPRGFRLMHVANGYRLTTTKEGYPVEIDGTRDPIALESVHAYLSALPNV